MSMSLSSVGLPLKNVGLWKRHVCVIASHNLRTIMGLQSTLDGLPAAAYKKAR